MAVHFIKKQLGQIDLFSKPAPITTVQTVAETELELDKWLHEQVAKFEFVTKYPKIVNPTSKWRVSSCLQKAIRRGDVDIAVRMASALVEFDSGYFFSRINVIALEDVGLGNLNTVATILGFSGRTAYLEKNYGLTKIAQFWAHSMASGIKDRTLCELAYIADSGPMLSQLRSEFGKMKFKDMTPEQVEHTLKSYVDIPSQVILLNYMAGTDKYKMDNFPSKFGCYDSLMAFMQKDLPPVVFYIALKGSKKSVHNLWQPIWLEWQFVKVGTTMLKTEMPESPMIHGVKAYSYDMHTQEGKRAYAYFSKACTEMREFKEEHHLTFDNLAAPAFIADSGLLDKTLMYPMRHMISEMDIVAGFETDGIPYEIGMELVRIISENRDVLDKSRIRIVVGKQEEKEGE